MTLEEWMNTEGLKDGPLAERLGCDRSIVSRLRRRLLEPSFDLAIKIEKISAGRVAPRDMVISKTDE